jgi:hypothetical protein
MPEKKQLTFWILISVSLLLSGTAIFLSTQKEKESENKVIRKTPEILQKERLDSVSKIIASTIEKERIYQSAAFHPLASETTVANARLNYQTEVAYALSSIKNLLKWDELMLMNSEMIIQYAKLENEYGDRKKAAKAYEYILENSDPLIFKNEAISRLAIIYADRSSLLYNPEKARSFQKKILTVEKKYPSKDRYERLAKLYEEWAKTEFIQFKDQEYGNKVLDSAFYCIRKLPDYIAYKDSLLQRLEAIYKYHNNILTLKTIAGDYKYYVNNVGTGTAKIAIVKDHLSLRIDYLEGNKLIGQAKGIGNFTDPELMIFDVTLKSYSDKFDSFRGSMGVIELKTEPNFLLKGTLKEFGEEAAELRLLKNNSDL